MDARFEIFHIFMPQNDFFFFPIFVSAALAAPRSIAPAAKAKTGARKWTEPTGSKPMLREQSLFHFGKTLRFGPPPIGRYTLKLFHFFFYVVIGKIDFWGGKIALQARYIFFAFFCTFSFSKFF